MSGMLMISLARMDVRSFADNRRRLCRILKASGAPSDGVVFLEGGRESYCYNTDLVIGDGHVFGQESFFFWTFGVTEPGFDGAVCIETGEAHLFMPKLDDDYAIWQGKVYDTDHFQQKYAVDRVHYTDEFESVFAPGTVTMLVMNGQNTDSGLTLKCEKDLRALKYSVNDSMLYDVISECRLYKNDYELDAIRRSCAIAAQAHVEVMLQTQPGMYEMQQEAIFRCFCALYGGCRHVCYGCIAGSGPNSATLHYGHAAMPNDRQIVDGDMCLVDMGTKYCGYASDITSTFPANGIFSNEQKLIYNGVLQASRTVMANIKPGARWEDLHLMALKVILDSLRSMGILQGDLEEMMDAELGPVFMPHGLGHMMGIDVHDVAGFPPKEGRSNHPCCKTLRSTRVLQPRMVITVEPGCYFISALLNKAMDDPSMNRFINIPRLRRFFYFGGVRIEDNVAVTENGCELLTNLPRTVEEIEHLMAGGRRVRRMKFT